MSSKSSSSDLSREIAADRKGAGSNRYYPMTFRPAYKQYVWGGRRLERIARRDLPDGIVAESWEVAAHSDGQSIVENGAYAGMRLAAVYEELGLDLVGRNNRWAHERGRFPLLVKLLDASKRLSVQVHPTDDYALAHEGDLGKSEMWVVLWAEAGAAVILGLNQATSAEELRAALAAGALEPYLQRVPVQAGDCICVPPGTLHAILEGAVLAEIQQNSNTTYRLFDWNRRYDGSPRELHVKQALQVINFEEVRPEKCAPQLLARSEEYERHLLCRNQYFTSERIRLKAGAQFEGGNGGRSLEIWGTLQGRASVEGVPLAAVRFALVPAAMKAFAVRAELDSVMIRVWVEAAE